MTHNYASIDVPEDEDPLDYHYTQRRAEILELVYRAGGPRRVNQSRLAERYGVTRSQISQDMDKIAESVEETLGSNYGALVDSAFDRIFDGLMEEGEWAKAWRVVDGYGKLLARLGHVETVPDKVDVRMSKQMNESEDYELIPDDAAIEAEEPEAVAADGGEDGD